MHAKVVLVIFGALIMCLRVCVSSGLMHEDFWFSCLRVLSEQGCFIITGFCTNSLISFYNLLLRTSFFCRDEEVLRMIRVLCRRTIIQSPFAYFFFLQGWGDSSHDQGAVPQDQEQSRTNWRSWCGKGKLRTWAYLWQIAVRRKILALNGFCHANKGCCAGLLLEWRVCRA